MTILQIILISAMGGSLLTTGALLGLENRSKKWEQKGELEIQKSLTAPDLLQIPCSSEYMGLNGEGLCREMFCRLQTREGDGASQSECEEIANLNNTISIIGACKENELEIDLCLKVLDTRK
jgi:hypothetical protein